MSDQSTAAVEFRSIEGFPGYRVGSDGSVWSCHIKGSRGRLSETWRRLKPGRRLSGWYPTVALCPGRISYELHRLVLMAFVGPCPPGMVARHLDGNPGNNDISNLCWGTRKENSADAIRHGTIARGERQGSSKLTAEQVRQIRAECDSGEFRYVVAAKHGISRSQADNIANRRHWGWLD